ncbi:MAG: ZIP family metal transporter [Erysipelotrichaceae bacterium]|nr:ZIP family metal transporter [Erysipelotrichaceae bacterium]
MILNRTVILGLLIPFIGTAAGSLGVFFMRKEMKLTVQKSLTGFASGVMTAASIWSLLIPAMEQSSHLEKWSFMPAVVGFWLGILFLLFLDTVTPHLHMHTDKVEGPLSSLHKTTMMLLAVTLHNIPEGMAVGVVYAAFISGSANISAGAALALALGIAIQNFPEGAIVSMPLHAGGESKNRAFLGGVLSGAVEPLFGLLTVVASKTIVPIMPYTLSFAAGAMLYVVVEELIPEMSSGEHSNIGVVMFSIGFTVMMALDVALG